MLLYVNNGDGASEHTKSQTEAWRSSQPRVNMSQTGCEPSRGGPDCSHYSSQIKMSTSMKKAIPLSSLIIRGSIFLFHIKRALWNQNDSQSKLKLIFHLDLILHFPFIISKDIRQHTWYNFSVFVWLFLWWYCTLLSCRKFPTISNLEKYNQRFGFIWSFELGVRFWLGLGIP